jgi:hypothetical protein
MRWFADAKSYYSAAGPRRFWTFFGGTILFGLFYAGAYAWLSMSIGWPENYGFDCRRRCLFEDLSYSPRLLPGGSAQELSLFVLLWSLPTILVGSVIYAIVKKLRPPPDKTTD